MAVNMCVISGNLVRNSELRQRQSGGGVLTFSVAVNDRRKNAQTGEWEDYPNYVDCVLFGKRAEKLQVYLAKGTKVAVEGKLRYSSWENQNGEKRSKLEVIADEVEFLSRAERAAGAGQQQAYGAPIRPMTGVVTEQPIEATLYDADLPF